MKPGYIVGFPEVQPKIIRKGAPGFPNREIKSGVLSNMFLDQRFQSQLILKVDDEIKDWLCEKGYDPKYGARPLNRLIAKEIGNKLADKIIRGEVTSGQTARVTFNADKSGLAVAAEAPVATETESS